MTVSCFSLCRSLINAIFFQTLVLSFKLSHKIIVLIWLQPSRKGKKLRVQSMLKFLNFTLIKRFLPPLHSLFSVFSNGKRVVCSFPCLFWQPAVAATGFPSLPGRHVDLEQSSSPVRAPDKTVPVFNIYGSCKFSQRILKSKEKRNSAWAGSYKLSRPLLLNIGWQ